MFDYEKMDAKLRRFLLDLLHDMSNLDRWRLHFALGNDVPRRLRELDSIKTTIRIFEHLIVNEKIFGSLMKALSACGRSDWAKRLKEFEQRFSLPVTHPCPSLPANQTLSQSVLDDLSDEREDSDSC